MKIKNILALLCFLCIGVSCSMEDDIMNDVGTKGTDSIFISEVYASMDLSLLAGDLGVSIKTTIEGPTDGTLDDMTGNEQSVVNCYIALYEYDKTSKNVGKFLTSYYYDYSRNTDDVVRDWGREDGCVYNLGGHVIFKIPRDPSERTDFKIVAIAQTTETGSSLASVGEISYANLKNTILEEPSTILVKVGETEILKGDDGTYPARNQDVYVSISENIKDLDQPAHSPVEITTRQRTGAVMLESFKIQKADGTAYGDVTIVGMSLLHSKNKGKVEGEVSLEDAYGEQLVSQVNLHPDGSSWTSADWADFNAAIKGADSSKKDIYRLYSYENTSAANDNITTLKIDYKYNNGKETGSCNFPIKSRKDEHSASFNQVWAGYLYKLDVTITNATVSVTTKCYTRNWIKNDIQVIEAVEKK